MLPKPGVYVTLATPSESAGSGLPFVLDPAHPTPNTYPAVTNIGYNPTFGPGALTVETHLLDFDADLYGKHLEVAFVERLRGEVTFTGPDSLVAQIKKGRRAGTENTGNGYGGIERLRPPAARGYRPLTLSGDNRSACDARKDHKLAQRSRLRRPLGRIPPGPPQSEKDGSVSGLRRKRNRPFRSDAVRRAFLFVRTASTAFL